VRYLCRIYRDNHIKILCVVRRDAEGVSERYREYQWVGVSLGWRINKLSARSPSCGLVFTGGPTDRMFISGALYTGNQWDVIPSSNSLATARRGDGTRVRAYTAIRARRGIIIIHKLINAADNIMDVSRISIKLKWNEESRNRNYSKALATFNIEFIVIPCRLYTDMLL